MNEELLPYRHVIELEKPLSGLWEIQINLLISPYLDFLLCFEFYIECLNVDL